MVLTWRKYYIRRRARSARYSRPFNSNLESARCVTVHRGNVVFCSTERYTRKTRSRSTDYRRPSGPIAVIDIAKNHELVPAHQRDVRFDSFLACNGALFTSNFGPEEFARDLFGQIIFWGTILYSQFYVRRRAAEKCATLSYVYVRSDEAARREPRERESHDPRCRRVRNSAAPEKRMPAYFCASRTTCDVDTAIFRHI